MAGFIGVSNFVECDVNGENPEAAVLDIKGECTITCSLKAPFKGEGIISARPEQLFFDEKEGLPGKIVISTFLGDFIEYEIELDNGQTVQLNEYTRGCPGAAPGRTAGQG
ncbi:MAG: TOBE domain-containing protein [Enterocloster clostridioformis]